MNARLMTAIALAALALAASGCSRVQTALTPEDRVVTVEATVAAPDAAVDGTLAPGMPEGVPLWPGAEVTYSGASAQTYNLTLVAKEEYEDVLAGLAAGFQEAGWDVAQEETGESGARSAVLTLSGPTAAGILTVTEVQDGTIGLAYVLTAAE